VAYVAHDCGDCLHLQLWAVECEEEGDGVIYAWVCIE